MAERKWDSERCCGPLAQLSIGRSNACEIAGSLGLGTWWLLGAPKGNAGRLS